MTWNKLGLVYCPNNNYDWMQTHAANPVAEHLENDVFRIYFSTRNESNISSLGFVDIDIKYPSEIINISNTPVLSPGELGTFDADGVSLACITHNQGKKYLYYLGWNLCKTVPWNNSIGLAIQAIDSNFERYSKGPLMGRDIHDPYTISYPWVMKDKDKWKMWYGTHLQWNRPEERESFLHALKYAESDDGIHWTKHAKIVLPIDSSKGEYAIAKPCVIKENDIYKMWYAHRGDKYRIGYAESKDGIQWIRKDAEAYINVSDSGWDSESIEYPFVFKHHENKYMLYNGNGYGKTGFGLAVWKD